MSIFTKKKEKLIFTTGNDAYPATPSQLKLLLKELRNLYGEKYDIMVWNHTLNLIVSGD